MNLSFCVLTKNSAPYIEKLLRSARSFADEIVVAVDSSSTDSTEELCGRYADKLFRVEPVGSLAHGLAWLQQQCEGDWVLRLDDDELPSERLTGLLPRLTRDPDITHYWIRRRWLFDAGGGWIDQHPWWPDWQMRLHRNISSIVRVPDRVHTRAEVWGGGRYVYEGSIYHLDLIYHDQDQRRRKVERGYERRTPGRGLLHYYVPEEVSPTTAPVPEDDAPLIPRPPAAWRTLLGDRLPRRGPAKRARPREVPLSEVRRASMQEFEPGPQLFRASLRSHDCPREMAAGGWRPVDVEVRNESPVVWAIKDLGYPVVRIGYHWVRLDGNTHVFDTHRDFLPHPLWPEESVRMPSSVRAPEEPGEYILRWDLIVENLGWFSQHGWKGPEDRVQVVGDGQDA